jgi:hypothetical protein
MTFWRIAKTLAGILGILQDLWASCGAGKGFEAHLQCFGGRSRVADRLLERCWSAPEGAEASRAGRDRDTIPSRVHGPLTHND